VQKDKKNVRCPTILLINQQLSVYRYVRINYY